MITDILDELFKADFQAPEAQDAGRVYDFVSRDSDILFVTIGDSWTYGWRLDEEGDRVSLTYGNLISEAIGADYLNIAFPATNNLWMLEKYLQLSSIKHNYSKIEVFITFTEYGREISTDFDLDPELNDLYRKATSARELAQALADYTSSKLPVSVNLHCGVNYVDNLYTHSCFVNNSWLETILDKKITEPCIALGTWTIDKYRNLPTEFNSSVNKDELTKELTDMLDTAARRYDTIYNTGYNHTVGYGHPNATGHAKWANYILKECF
jgi:hypothetical protein